MKILAAYLATNESVKALLESLELIMIGLICLGTAPTLIWLSTI